MLVFALLTIIITGNKHETPNVNFDFSCIVIQRIILGVYQLFVRVYMNVIDQ